MKIKVVTLLFMALVCRTFAITLNDVQKMKNDLDKELKMMDAKTNQKAKHDKKDESKGKDKKYEDILQDLVEKDIADSLKGLSSDPRMPSEKEAQEILKNLVKVERDRANTGDDDDFILDSLIQKEIEARVRAEEGKEIVLAAKSETLHNDVGPKILAREEALKALALLKMSDAEGHTQKKSLRDTKEYKRLLQEVSDASPAGGNKHSCKDERHDCTHLRQYCELDGYKELMGRRCAYTCRACHRCTDELPRKRCLFYKRFCKSKGVRDRLKHYCYLTCGYCRQKSPPACQLTEFGCCWTNLTKKNDPVGSNCPKCIDQYKYLCKNFDMECPKDSTPGKYVRKHCPETCGICPHVGAKCMDKTGYEKLCHKWKKEGYCEVMDIARIYCKKTCDFCKGKGMESGKRGQQGHQIV